MSRTRHLTAPTATMFQSITRLARRVFYCNGTAIVAAAIACLALVILFVFLLHIYAKWFLHVGPRSTTSETPPPPPMSPTRPLEQNTAFDDYSSVVASIPCFVYESSEHSGSSECVVCLSDFETDDVGRALPQCGHCFHVECIDMWLRSHSNCPICRAPTIFADKNVTNIAKGIMVSNNHQMLNCNNV